jgi:hypothetical protein
MSRPDFLNTHLIDEVIAFQIGHVRSLFVVGQMRANPVDHCPTSWHFCNKTSNFTRLREIKRI